MRATSGTDILALWERAQAASPDEVARALVAYARPDLSPDELAALPLGRRDRTLLDLRAAVLGPEMTLRAACPRCGEPIEAEIPDLRGEAPPASAGEHVVNVGEHSARFRLPTGADAAAAAAAVDPEAELLRRCVLAPASALAPELAAAVLSAMAELDPDADLQLALACPACDHAWVAAFDVIAFFRAELTAWATRLVHEVAGLARAYGWREADILEMSPARRQLYLALAP